MANKKARELVLAQVAEGDEGRCVTAVCGVSLAVSETSRGPVTEVAYGSPMHGHKVFVDAGALMGALARAVAADSCDVDEGEPEDRALRALQVFFAPCEGEVALLSDLMDCLDAAGVAYTYAAWSGGGDMVMRAG